MPPPFDFEHIPLLEEGVGKAVENLQKENLPKIKLLPAIQRRAR
jgi:hypothetical protein